MTAIYYVFMDIAIIIQEKITILGLDKKQRFIKESKKSLDFLLLILIIIYHQKSKFTCIAFSKGRKNVNTNEYVNTISINTNKHGLYNKLA